MIFNFQIKQTTSTYGVHFMVYKSRKLKSSILFITYLESQELTFFFINTIFIKYFTDHFYIVKEIGLYGTRHNIILVLYMYQPCLKL